MCCYGYMCRLRDLKGDCGSYKGRLRLIRLAVIVSKRGMLRSICHVIVTGVGWGPFESAVMVTGVG